MEAGLPADLPRLRAPEKRPAIGIVHLGLGAFFRAHGAIYIAEAMEKSGGDWSICGVSLKSPGTRDALAPQGGAYTAVELAPDGTKPRVITSVAEVLVAPEDPAAVLSRLTDPAVKIVSLTVTEKGYCHDPATGALNPDHPDIRHDLAASLPASAPGYVVRALALRRAAGLAPFTVLSCDNLPDNGSVVRGVVLDLARRIDPDLADWIAAHGRFPATMVDRIVPATSAEDIEATARLTGYDDRAPVMHEPFRQWVIQDDFVNDDRPDLAGVGAQLVGDVTPFEHMKLRMLNGTHSALAYLGYLAGHETIADCAADPVMAGYVKRLWRAEIIPALTPPEGTDLDQHADALFARYENPAIRHRTWQIAMDGSQKLPQRILATLAENHAAGRDSHGLCLAVAGWMRYVSGVDLDGNAIDVRDPLADRLRLDGQTGAARVDALLALREVFPQTVAETWRDPIVQALHQLETKGVRDAIRALPG
ncbi:mannitol dehydrogenase family protein [Oceaniglobus indicus]|uniref:mannitol dehydrogenase family protein n=1 Tax=Oceaniglobus indicus TaxID=2047749 RepID=UPI000C1791DE|nr:mannitol dehydrogenase family protein [Oceaniglobus indicus]